MLPMARRYRRVALMARCLRHAASTLYGGVADYHCCRRQDDSAGQYSCRLPSMPKSMPTMRSQRDAAGAA